MAFANTDCSCPGCNRQRLCHRPRGDAQRAALDTARIEQVTGLKGSFSERENVFKVSKPRNDVPIQVDGVAMPPFMGLTSWAAFTQPMTATPC
jgi:hypothetical protein